MVVLEGKTIVDYVMLTRMFGDSNHEEWVDHSIPYFELVVVVMVVEVIEYEIDDDDDDDTVNDAVTVVPLY